MPKTLTAGTPWRVILAFSIPLLIGNVIQQFYHVVDAMVVGQVLGVNALAAVGATGSILFLLLGFSWGMTSGFAIPTAQAFGARDTEGVRRSVAAGTILTGVASLIMTVAAPLVAEPLIILMRTPPELVEGATTFAVISFLGASATMFFNFLSAIIRANGDSKTPLYFLVMACVLNIILVIAFVGMLGFGIAGAAAATVVSQLFSVLACLVYVRRSQPALHVSRTHWKVSRQDLKEHLRIGLPMGFQASIVAIGSLAVQVRLNTLGADAVAAYTTAGRVDGIAVAFLASIGLAVATFTAQNYGAGKIDRINVGVRHAIWMSVGTAIALGVLLVVAGGPIVRSFVGSDAQNVVDMAHWFLVVNGATYWILGILFVTRGALQGLGRTLSPTISGLFELVMRVAAAIVLGGLFGFNGIVWSNPMAWIAAVVLLLPAWWATKKAIDEESTAATPTQIPVLAQTPTVTSTPELAEAFSEVIQIIEVHQIEQCQEDAQVEFEETLALEAALTSSRVPAQI